MSSPDNPQFEAPPPVTVEPQGAMPMSPDPFGTAQLTPNPSLSPIVKDPVWSGWDVLLIALLTFATIVVLQLLAPTIAMRIWFRHETWMTVAQKPILLIVSQFVAYIAVASYMIMLVQGKYHQPFWPAIRWNWPKFPWLILMLILGMFTVLLDLLSRYLPMPKTTPFDQFFAHPSDAYLMVVFAVTFGPLMEEMFFRGFLYPVLQRRIGVLLAVLFTALPFGLIHYVQYKSWAAVLVITLVGVVLTTVRAVTKSVAASFLVHVGYNGTLMTLAALATDGFRHMEKAAMLQF